MGETNSPQVPEMQRSGSDPLTEARQPTMVVTRSGNGTYVEWFDAEGHLKDNWAMHIDPTPDEMFTREMADEIERSHRLLAVLADQLEAADSRKRELEAAIAVHKVQKLRPQWVTGGGHDLALWALIEDEKAAPEAKVTDLMEALQQSVAAARAENRRAVAPEDEQKENGRG